MQEGQSGFFFQQFSEKVVIRWRIISQLGSLISQRFCLYSMFCWKIFCKDLYFWYDNKCQEVSWICLAPRLNNVSGFNPAYNAESWISYFKIYPENISNYILLKELAKTKVSDFNLMSSGISFQFLSPCYLMLRCRWVSVNVHRKSFLRQLLYSFNLFVFFYCTVSSAKLC